MGDPRQIIPALARELGVGAVHASHDDDPAPWRAMPGGRRPALPAAPAKDHVVLGAPVLTAAGRPYTVFTPYKRAWLQRLRPRDMAERVVQPDAWCAARTLPSLSDLGFEGPPT